jgi:APA family basic amino acid/polyamine antiporter
MVACSRGVYALAARDEGIAPKIFRQIDKETNMPHNSATFGLFLALIWFVYFIGGQFLGWFGGYAFDSSELPIITVYPMYVPILINYMIKEKDIGVFKRFVLPILSIAGAGVMVAASIFRHKMGNVWYLIVFAVVMAAGAVVYYLYNKKAPAAEEVGGEE